MKCPFQLGTVEEIPHSANDEGLEQGPKEDVEICSLGSFQSFARHGPKQPDLTL